jgi:hypothetical protein
MSTQFFSPLLTKIECRTKDAITQSRGAGSIALEKLRDFVEELKNTVRSLEDAYRETYEAELERSDPSFCEAQAYLEPQMFLVEECSTVADHDIRFSRANSQDPPGEAGSFLNLPSQPQGGGIQDSDLESGTINPRLISTTQPVRSTTSPMQSESPSRNSEKRARRLDSFNRQGRKVKLRPTSTSSSRRHTEQFMGERKKGITGSSLCVELNPVVQSLIWGVAGIASIIQLKQALPVLRERMLVSKMNLPSSTKEIWKHLDILESKIHTNYITYRIFLVRLDSRRNDLKKTHGKKAVDEIAREAEEENRDKLKNRLHAGGIWNAISEQFSPGVLALIPTGRAEGPSNTA